MAVSHIVVSSKLRKDFSLCEFISNIHIPFISGFKLYTRNFFFRSLLFFEHETRFDDEIIM